MMALSVDSGSIQNKITLTNGHEIKSDALVGKTQQQLKDLKVSEPTNQISGLKDTTFKGKGEFAFIDELGKNTFYAFNEDWFKGKETYTFNLSGDNSRTGNYAKTSAGTNLKEEGQFAIVDKVDDKGSVTGHELIQDFDKKELQLADSTFKLQKTEGNTEVYVAAKIDYVDNVPLQTFYELRKEKGSLEGTLAERSGASEQTKHKISLVQADTDDALEVKTGEVISTAVAPVAAAPASTAPATNTHVAANTSPASGGATVPLLTPTQPQQTTPVAMGAQPANAASIPAAGTRLDLKTVKELAKTSNEMPNLGDGFVVASKKESDGGIWVTNKATGVKSLAYSVVVGNVKQTYLVQGNVETGDRIAIVFDAKKGILKEADTSHI